MPAAEDLADRLGQVVPDQFDVVLRVGGVEVDDQPVSGRCRLVPGTLTAGLHPVPAPLEAVGGQGHPADGPAGVHGREVEVGTEHPRVGCEGEQVGEAPGFAVRRGEGKRVPARAVEQRVRGGRRVCRAGPDGGASCLVLGHPAAGTR